MPYFRTSKAWIKIAKELRTIRKVLNTPPRADEVVVEMVEDLAARIRFVSKIVVADQADKRFRMTRIIDLSEDEGVPAAIEDGSVGNMSDDGDIACEHWDVAIEYGDAAIRDGDVDVAGPDVEEELELLRYGTEDEKGVDAQKAEDSEDSMDAKKAEENTDESETLVLKEGCYLGGKRFRKLSHSGAASSSSTSLPPSSPTVSSAGSTSQGSETGHA